MAGAAIAAELRRAGFTSVLPEPAANPDLGDPVQVRALYDAAKPEYVFVAAGRSGGIGLNRRAPADLMLDNLRVSAAVIPQAHRAGVRKLLYLASSCVYPRDCPQPAKPEYLGTGPLEPTNAAYATAKLAGIRLCQAFRQQYGCDFIVGIPATTFGPGDHFDPDDSHVVGALIRRMEEARHAGSDRVVVWGSGGPQRDFIFAEDLAAACVVAMRRYSGELPLHLGPGEGQSIAEVAKAIRVATGFQGRIEFDASRPDGVAVKYLEASTLRELGWRPRFAFGDALARTVAWFRCQEFPPVPPNLD
jgi:GDP-L-fucose synthase